MDTRTLSLPASGQTAEVKKYMTGGDWEDIQEAIVGEMEIDPKDPKPMLKGHALVKANAARLVAFVVSLDGSTENIVERCRALPASDYQLLLNQAEKVQSDEGKAETVSGS